MTPPSPPRPGCDTLIRNAKVITCDATDRIARAVAVHDGRIMAVGTDDELAPLADGATRVIDAGGRAVIPGLIDAQVHMDREGLKGVFPSLAGCRSVADVLDRVRELARAAGPGEWVVTMPIGEPPYYFDVPDNLAEKRFPTRQELDRAAPDNPVYIRPIWGYWRHELPLQSVANSLALAEAGLTPGHPDLPPSVTLETDPASGEATGLILEDSFMPIVELAFFAKMPRFGHADRVAGLKQAMRQYNRTGTTSVFEEHGVAQEVIQAYQAVRRADAQTVRASLVYSPSWHFLSPQDYPRVLEGWAGWLGGRGLGDDWLRVEGLYVEPGISLENALRARATPYTGWAGFNYDCGIPEDALVEFMIAAARHDIRVSTITIDFLDRFEQVDRVVPLAGRRWIIGHLNLVTPDQIERIRRLGLVMSAHTNRYVYKHGHLMLEKAGPGHENDVEPLRSLLEAWVHVGLATDNVPTSLWHPIWQAVTRRNLYTQGTIAPDQALTREQALRMATIEAAHITFEEDIKGSLEPGKLADLAILTDDPLTCPEDVLRDIGAELTMVGGRVVYERNGDED